MHIQNGYTVTNDCYSINGLAKIGFPVFQVCIAYSKKEDKKVCGKRQRDSQLKAEIIR